MASANDVTAMMTGTSNPTVTADQVAAQCESIASQSPTGSTTITNGVLTPLGGVPLAMPANPAPNTVFFNATTGPTTSVQVILNEQTLTPDGGLTVNAMHITELSLRNCYQGHHHRPDAVRPEHDPLRFAACGDDGCGYGCHVDQRKP